MSRKIRASITISASIDLDEFNADVDEISDTVREYIKIYCLMLKVSNLLKLA